jgi:2-haloacid dehalogenase
MGAQAFGFRTIWINRAGLPDEYPAHAPERVMPDLRSLTELA